MSKHFPTEKIRGLSSFLVTVIRTMFKSNMGKKGVKFYQRAQVIIIWDIRVGIQNISLEAGAEGEAVEERCFLA